MPWLQLDFTVNKHNAAALEQQLIKQGAQSLTLRDALDEPQFEPAPGETPLWSRTVISALFETSIKINLLLEHIQRAIDFPLPRCDIDFLGDKDWERAWMEDFKPIQVGTLLWICPSWLNAPDPNAVNLVLDPGLAFGSGTHPTTLLCLEWLDQQATAGRLQNTNVIDYGCGSGILAIAALMLGSQSAIAIDHDPQAILATKDNAEKNNIEINKLKVSFPDDIPENPPVDIFLANILAQPLITLAEKFSALCPTGCQLVLSGILKEQVNSVCNHYTKSFKIHGIENKSEWTIIRLERR